MIAAAVALLSAALLAYEILLVRLFAIAQFHHFATMAIGLAMLGFGAAGTLLALAPRLGPPGVGTHLPWLRRFTGLAALLLLLGPALSLRLPLDTAQLPWDPSQAWRLAVSCLLLAAPLMLGALAILMALGRAGSSPGRIYGASFAGSGVGALLAMVSLAWLPLDRALAVPALLAGVAALLFALPGGSRFVRLAALTVVLATTVAVARPPWRVAVNPYKGLPQIEAFPGALRVAERWSPLGWTVAVAAPSFRHAPGLSLGYQGAVPPQTALFVDGEIVGAVADWSDTSVAVLDALPTSLPYALGARERVLVLGSGGNTEVWNTAVHGARRVVAVEINPDVVALSRTPSPPGVEVEWVEADARAFVARTRERFDLVTLPPGGGLGSSAAGLHALGESFLHTAEAYEAYLGRLSPDGVLAVTSWLTSPPRESVRLVLAAAEALRHVPNRGLAQGLIVSRSWGTVTVLVKPSGFADAEVAAVRRWAEERLLDLDWDPWIGAEGKPQPPSFNQIEGTALGDAARAASAGGDEAAVFARNYPFAVAPATDARPYPRHFIRAGMLPRFLGGDVGRWLPFAEWGFVALVATLALSVVIGAALMLAPVLLRRTGDGRAALSGYFAAIGFAYLFAEIAALQPLGLLVGHPIYAVSALLALLLILSGLGSLLSDRIAVERSWKVLAGLAIGSALVAAAFLPLAHAVAGAPLVARALIALATLAPLAFLMGMPFPLGMRRLVGEDRGRLAWAWAANGVASVVAAPLAALVALEVGTAALLLLAAAAYAGAALIHRLSLPSP